MVENPTPDFGGQTPVGSPSGQWTPTQPKNRSGSWLAIPLAAIATTVAIAALIVAFTRPSPEAPSTEAKPPSYSAAETAAAQQQLCDTYKLEARTVRSDTSGNDEALARIAATNGAVMLYNAAANPAIDAKYRDTARALATAYGNVSAMGSKGVASDAEWRAVLDEANAKDAAMRQLCGSG